MGPVVEDGEYRVVAPYFVVLVCVKKGRVTNAAPIVHWTIGKSASYVFNWFINRKFEITKLK